MSERVRPSDHRLWRLLRRLLPPGFRERQAAAVLETHVRLAGGAGSARGARFWSRVALDLLITSVRLRLDRLLEPGNAERRGAMGGLGAAGQSFLMAVRGLRRSPYFAVAVVLILGLGIASNVTIFRVLDRLLLSPPERIRSPEQVKRVYVYGRSPFTREVEYSAALAYPDYRGLAQVSAFDAFAGYSSRTLTLYADGAGEAVAVEMATATYFELLGVRAAVGRFFGEAEDSPGEPGTAVLSWSFWQRRFGGDRAVLGRELSIGKSSYTVIGIAPRGFTGVEIQEVDVWLPLRVALAVENGGTDWVDAHGWYLLAGIARVTADVTRAEAEATAVSRRVREGARGADPDARIVLSPLIRARGPLAPRESRVATMLAALTVLVLLITCANVGNLYLARVLARRRELAVQVSLGVSRGRLFTQLMAEVLLVALAAGSLAFWIGSVAAGSLFRMLLPEAAAPVGAGPRVLLLTTALALFTAVLTGVLPALRATRVDLMDVLRGRTGTRRALLVRRGLLGIQAALSVVLLVGAGLFIRSLRRAETVDLGIDTRVLTVSIELPDGVSFGDGMADEVLRLLPLVRESGLVEQAAAASIAPFAGWWGLSVSDAAGDTVPSGRTGPFVYGVSGDYFAAVGLPVVRGRPLTDADAGPGAPPVVVINERLAERLWPDGGAIGECLVVESSDDPDNCSTVVGVVGDFMPAIEADEAPFVFYVAPGHIAVGTLGANTLLVRARNGVTPEMVRDFIRGVAPDLRRISAGPLSQRLEPTLRAWRLGASLLSAVGVLALIISAAGLYSMLAFDVLQRRRELGIRAALGASSGGLIRSTIAASFTAVAIGVGLGVIGSLAGGRVIEAMLFRVTAHDAGVYLAVSLTLLLTGGVAAAVPAWRITRTDPAIPLREE